MAVNHLSDAIASLEKANADLEPELMTADDAREVLGTYARAEKLAAFGIAALARKVDNTSEVAKATGTSMGAAKETIAAGKTAAVSDDLDHAMRSGNVSLVQAAEIAKAEALADAYGAALQGGGKGCSMTARTFGISSAGPGTSRSRLPFHWSLANLPISTA